MARSLPLLVAAAMLPGAPAAREGPARAEWVAFTLTPGNQIRFAATIEGEAVSAILDTGISHSVLSRASPLAAASRVSAGGSAEAVGGAVAIGWASLGRIAIGGRTLPARRVVVAAIPAAATGGDAPVDLLIGLDLIGAYAIDIDFAARRLRLIATGTLPFRGVAAPLTRDGAPRTAIRIETTTLAPVLVDTGDGAAVTVTRAGWNRVAPPGVPVSTTLGIGIGGPIVTEVAHAAVAIGDGAALETEVRIEPGDGFSAREALAGRIGSGLLGRYRVLLDRAAGRMVLAPATGGDRPPLRSTTGLMVVAESAALRIVHVMRASPAADTGFVAGERICAVDGAPVGPGYAGSVRARWPVAPPGTPVRLTLCDGAGERRLVARHFY